MAQEIMVLTKSDLKENPTVIGESIAKLAMAIVDNKGDIKELRDRGFWQRITTNNTRDIAEALMKQNETISGFLTIINGIINLSMNNVVILGGIMDALTKYEYTNDLKDNQYFNMAKDYLTEAIKSAQMLSDNMTRVQELEEIIDEQISIQHQHSRVLSDLDKEFKENTKVVTDHIHDLTIATKNQNEYIEKLNKLVVNLEKDIFQQKKEKEQQQIIINEFVSNIHNLTSENKILTQKVENLESLNTKNEKIFKGTGIVAIVSLALAVLQFFI